ncbi:helix-turn-helix transcriptional regulator, partial [Streptomyces microflavus]|uniref:helix-turn-helix domain-containing protein n=1 Tax=Streptomyces microflavus TaxID=1919 RepID=UPI0033B19B9F
MPGGEDRVDPAAGGGQCGRVAGDDRETNREIAGALHLSPRTVEQHVYRIMRKTHAVS